MKVEIKVGCKSETENFRKIKTSSILWVIILVHNNFFGNQFFCWYSIFANILYAEPQIFSWWLKYHNRETQQSSSLIPTTKGEELFRDRFCHFDIYFPPFLINCSPPLAIKLHFNLNFQRKVWQFSMFKSFSVNKFT